MWCIVDKCTTALPFDGAYDIMVRFPEHLNTEDLSGLAPFGCISGGISAFFEQNSTHMNYYIRIYRNLNYFFLESLIRGTLGQLPLFLIKTMDNTLKYWEWHILVMKYFTLGPFSPGRVNFDPPRGNFDLGSILFISLPKLTQSTQYFVCCLHSHYLGINRNHSSMIKRYTILQWFTSHPPSPPRVKIDPCCADES